MMVATKVAGVRGEPNPSPTGLGVPQVGTMKGSGVCVGEGGKGQPPCSNGLEDVEGSFCVPSSSSSGFGVTAVVSGRDTAVENIGGNEQSSGVLGPRVSCPPTVLNMRSNQDGMKRPKRKRWNEDITTLRREGETHLADKVARATAQGATRTQIRHMKQQHRRKAKRKRTQKLKRTMQVRRAAQHCLKLRNRQNKAKKRFKILTWNTRGWGAPYTTLDPEVKARCLVQLIEARGVGLAVFTDLKFPEQGLRTYQTQANKFTMLVTGTIGFMMNEQWFQWWSEGGRQWVMPTTAENERIRTAAIVFPRKGWKRGLYVVGVYAPTSSARKKDHVGCLRQVQSLLDKTPGSFMKLVAGDCNNEFGKGSNGGWTDVIGEHGFPRRSIWGTEWLEFCRGAGLLDAHSFFTQQSRGTWWHPRFSTEHTLDHMFMSKNDRWHLLQCHAVHVGYARGQGHTGDVWHWGSYTDHHPVELVLRTGKLWVPQQKKNVQEPKADVAKIWGSGEQAQHYRAQFQAHLSQQLDALQQTQSAGWQDIVTTCKRTAITILGAQQQTGNRPWLQGHMDILKQLDAEVSQAQQQDRAARSHPRPWDPITAQHAAVCRQKLNQVRRKRRQAMGEWETTYWSTLAQQALVADQNKDQGELFRIHGLLGAHRNLKRRDGAQVLPTDIEAEREAWKEHFRTIQAGEGAVPDNVWENIQKAVYTADWLARTPTIEEIERVIGQLQNRRAAGEDGFMAEFLKYGGPTIQKAVHSVIFKAWEWATNSGDNLEAAEWPDEWKVGLVVPLWKRKGDKADRNTWRGITLLSVGTKVMARLITNRLTRWSNPWLHESQTGFRSGCGTDDVHQVSRRVAEEISRTSSDEVVLIRFFDIEKAYPRVCRPAMWKVLEHRGCPKKAIKILQALHNHTEMKVRVHGGISSGYIPDRGLREGCPSSPVLFNIYHDAVMEDFRTRRATRAQNSEQIPGIEWEAKIDGKLTKRFSVRTQAGQETRTDILGDMGYADDTAILGEAEEVMAAEKLFTHVLQEWEEKVHPTKTEGLRLSGTGGQFTDVQNFGEAKAVKHVGGWVAANGRPHVETAKRREAISRKATAAARTWSFGGSRLRRQACNIKRSVRLSITKAVVLPTALATARTRAWDSLMITRIQQSVSAALRKSFCISLQTMQEHHITHEKLRKAAGWAPVKEMVMKASLTWLGHVARMSPTRRPKQMLFGWWKARTIKANTWTAQSRWLERCLKDAQIPVGDWFRLAQARSKWRKLVNEAFPTKELTLQEKRQLDQWRPGSPLPDNSAVYGPVGDQPGRDDGRFHCWVCTDSFLHGNSLQAHYDETHAVCTPDLVTTFSCQCTHCLQHFPTLDKRDTHFCPATQPLNRLNHIDRGDDPGECPYGEGRIPEARHIYTDGSGDPTRKAGWAAIVYAVPPQRPVTPDYILYGPVLTEVWDPLYIGAEDGTNNTGELTAIAEACQWLLDTHSDTDAEGKPVPAVIHYDSEYARDIAVRVAVPHSNKKLAETVATLVEQVREIRELGFKHVKGHSQDIGNDTADKYANWGREGRVSCHWTRWCNTPAAWQHIQTQDPRLKEACRHCGKLFLKASTRGAHEGKCTNIGVSLPDGRDRCRKCGLELQHRSVRSHEALCRGSQEQNTHCQYCGLHVEPFRLLKVHEFDCQRLRAQRVAKAAAPPPPAILPAMQPHEAAPGQCHQCGMQCGRNLSRHTPRCRGSELANRTCQNCGRVFVSWDALRRHEPRCRV